MCDPISIGIGLTAVSTGLGAYGQYQEGRANAKQYEYSAAVARQEGEAALKRGETQANLIQDSAKAEGLRQAQSVAQLSASQRAALAANGITGVTSEDITLDTANKAKMDEMAIRHNADLQSWSAKNQGIYENWQSQAQATQYDAAAKNAKKASKIGIFSTLLGGAAQVAGGFGQLSQKPAGTMTSSGPISYYPKR